MASFFVSYNKADKAWAEWVAWHLEEADYDVVIQAWDFTVGRNFVLDMQKAASSSERTIAILSAEYLNALYTQPEWAAAFVQDPTGTRGLLIPIRVSECELTGLLKPITYIDLVGQSESRAKELLIKGVSGGRPKPVDRPAFPGGSGAASHVNVEKPRFPQESPGENALAAEGIDWSLFPRDGMDEKELGTLACKLAGEGLYYGNLSGIGAAITKAIFRVGLEGTILVDSGTRVETSVEFCSCVRMERGFLSPYFITETGSDCIELKNVRVLLSGKPLSSMQEVDRVLDAAEMRSGNDHSLLVVADGIEDEALERLIAARNHGISVVATLAPGFGDRRRLILMDIAIATGGNFIDADGEVQITDFQLGDLGRAKKALIDSEQTLFIGTSGDPRDIEGRIEEIQRAIESEESDYFREKLGERLLNLNVALIRVGGSSVSDVDAKVQLTKTVLWEIRDWILNGKTSARRL